MSRWRAAFRHALSCTPYQKVRIRWGVLPMSKSGQSKAGGNGGRMLVTGEARSALP